ncbi:hypothetical protein JCM11641_002880 [Rhodosporidiobolus odoratus]
MPDLELVKNLLYGMDDELAIRSVDYTRFDRTARDQWTVIAARRADVARQVGTARKAATSAASGKVTGTTASNIPAPTSNRSTTPAPSTAQPGSAALTPLERSYLNAQLTAAPNAASLPASFKVGNTVPLPPGFVPSSESYVPAPASSTPATAGTAKIVIGLRGFALLDEDNEDGIEELDWTSGDEEECVELHLPSLHIQAGFPSATEVGEALADSGCSSIYVSDRMVSKLGLANQKLKRCRTTKLAIKGGAPQDLVISHFVRVPLRVEHGYDFGTTLLKVAPLEAPYDFILGNPFLHRHRLSIHLHPTPRIVRAAYGNEPEIDRLKSVAPHGPATLIDSLPTLPEERRNRLHHASVLARISVLEEEVKSMQEEQEERKRMQVLKDKMMEEFKDRFPNGIPPLSRAEKSSVRHFIKLVDPNRVHNQRGFPSPARWNLKWKALLDKHVEAGRLRLSQSSYASPSFVQPKKDPMADPRWLNDYRRLNANTVKDRTPLPVPDEILAQGAQAKYWGKIDMSDAFFQTLVNEDDIPKTAIKTPWGLCEWVVMPQGLCNAPATHQRRMNEALTGQIGRICHAFVDDILIWASSLEEHEKNLREVLSALRRASLYCSPKKTDLVTIDTEFLGHRISRHGIAADPNKIERVVNWTTPTTVKQLRGFLGLVQYMRKFIVGLAQHTALLTPLTQKALGDITGLWGEKEQRAFEEIRRVVTSLPVLRPVDHSEGAEPIWIMTDASNVGVGAVLLQGADWKTAHPCSYYSRQYIPAERNYPTHEQEILAIVAALKAWRIELLGEKLTVLTDHDTLRHFRTQPDLSKRQARWSETLADYDFETIYVPGERNTVADGLSRFPCAEDQKEPGLAVMGVSEVSLSKAVLDSIRVGYTKDSECERMAAVGKTSTLFREEEGLLYTDDGRLVVPMHAKLRETLRHDAHDAAGHLGALKTYEALSRSFYWPGMSREVKRYCKSCDLCQRMKADTQKSQGAPHPLPVPPSLFTDVALDFVGPLPKSHGHDYLLTISDRLSGYVRLIPCSTKDDARTVASLFFEHWVCLIGQPARIVSDRDRLCTSRFWKSLQRVMGTKLQMSTSFHPETDGRSERTNKTVVQVLRGMVSRRQTVWASHLALTEYSLNCAVNVSTGKAPFELVLGFVPRILPIPGNFETVPSVEEVTSGRAAALKEAQDVLRWAKTQQAEQSASRRRKEDTFAVGDLVLVSSRDRRRLFKASGDKSLRSAKLFPRYDGPYPVVTAFPDQSLYHLQLGPDDHSFPKFHISKLRRYVPNDDDAYPNRTPPRPEAIKVDGVEEYVVEKVVDERKRRGKWEFLVKWEGYPDAENTWEPENGLLETEALEKWRKEKDEEGS